MITFLVNKDDTEKTFECSLEDSILSLKNKIIQDFDLSCDYIDIDFQLVRPIRSLGKFNLESGILPRPLDNYTFDRYGLDGKTVNATFHIVEDYDHKKYSKKFSKKYNHINVLKTREEMKIDENFEKSYNESKNINFNLNSETDFPSLG